MTLWPPAWPPLFQIPQISAGWCFRRFGMVWPFFLHLKAPDEPGDGKGTFDHIQSHKEKEMKLLEGDKNSILWTEPLSPGKEWKWAQNADSDRRASSWLRFCPRGAAERSRSSWGGLTFHAGCHVPQGITSFLQAHQELFSRLNLLNNFIIDLGIRKRTDTLNMQRFVFYILTNNSNCSS